MTLLFTSLILWKTSICCRDLVIYMMYFTQTLRQLSGMYLKVPMSGDNPWILTAKHVRVALRKAVSLSLGIVAVALHIW